MPKFVRNIRRARLNIFMLCLILSVCFTAPIMYFSGIFCRTSPYTISQAVSIIESNKAIQFAPYNPSSTPTPTPTPTPSDTLNLTPFKRKHIISKYDIMNDVNEGDDQHSFNLDVENDIVLNGSIQNLYKRPNESGDDLNEDELVKQVTISSRSDWLGVSAYHKFCQKILDEPIEMIKPICTRGITMECLNGDLKGKIPYFSYDNQDYYIYLNHFKYLNDRSGIYIDVGTKHPIINSNSYFFDTCLRWKGLCIEINSDFYQFIYRQRSCDLIPTCISQYDTQKIEFIKRSNFHININNSYLSYFLHLYYNITSTNINPKFFRKSKLTCTNLSMVTKRSNIKLIDLATINSYGMEVEILKGIDFNSMLINVILISVIKETLPIVESLLKDQGYVRHIPTLNEQSTQTGLLGRDAIFLHHDVIWGNPV